VPAPRFGLSTHIFHDETLTRDHLVRVARHGFDAVELFADRPHFDYRDEAAIAAAAEWLQSSGLTLHSVHAPIYDRGTRSARVEPLSVASADERRRDAALDAARATLAIAARVPFHYLVVHLGIVSPEAGPGENRPEAARRSLEALAALAGEVGVRVAAEVIPNDISSPAALVQLIEEDLDGLDVGVCLDYGHAHMMGDLGDAIETLSGHIWTTHVHDNRGTRDEHLVPFAGTIDWDAAMMGTQKIGYEGLLVFEVAGAGSPADVLARTARARERLQRSFIAF
jgi:sugar phosphate isomerase/epimerase